ncbi:hypothetical protein [Arenimonas fontis]|uniref:Uncharacterized protein n=1 Tax=Arenimonas fontis TaxID=2608255 RepID=A0A5B2ZF88_9GAMM|nr:hypothetical protein [Arenimonas fontis]KAA2285762.1 hypothetical protein F0415_03825 [Arenimonas fontis]
MKAVILALAAVSILALTACVSTSSTYAQRLGPAPRVQYDTEYMAKVEAANRQVGSRVVWINPPTKPVEEEVASAD